MRVWQAMRRRWRQLVSEAHDAVVAEAVVTAVLTAAVVAAAPFSAKELAPRADEDADWAAILEALRRRRAEAKAARMHVKQV